MTSGSRSTPRALEGLKVLDLATFIAGPFTAGLLAELGADVIKVEQPGSGDALRELGEKKNNRALYWALEGRGRRSVTLNLRDPRGQDLARELIRRADIVIENFRPGTLERWNLGEARMREVNPDVILLRVSAYGQTGPYANRPGFGRIAQAFGGLTYLAGHADRPPVLPGSATLADYAAGLFGAYAVLAATLHRDRTGEGQVIDVSLYESIFRLTDQMSLAYDALGIVRERRGSEAHATPHNHYPTADGKWMAIACTSDRLFRRLAAVVDASEEEARGGGGVGVTRVGTGVAPERVGWAEDPEFATMELRVARRAEVDERVGGWTQRHTLDELRERLDAAEVPNSPIYSVADCFNDPQYAARETLVSVDDPVLGPVRMPAPVPRLSVTPAGISRPAPELGEHNGEVYGELGVVGAELAELREGGVI